MHLSVWRFSAVARSSDRLNQLAGATSPSRLEIPGKTGCAPLNARGRAPIPRRPRSAWARAKVMCWTPCISRAAFARLHPIQSNATTAIPSRPQSAWRTSISFQIPRRNHPNEHATVVVAAEDVLALVPMGDDVGPYLRVVNPQPGGRDPKSHATQLVNRLCLTPLLPTAPKRYRPA